MEQAALLRRNTIFCFLTAMICIMAATDKTMFNVVLL